MRMGSLSRALLFHALLAGHVPPAPVLHAARAVHNAPSRYRGEPVPKRGTRSTTVAAMKRAAAKRRNARARSSKRR